MNVTAPPRNGTEIVLPDPLDEHRPVKWKRNPIGLWIYAGMGAVRIILSGLSILIIRR
ncbi:hypothetical protein [Sphingomonas immobilis]|uniref:hypothetical protein n=1 Tax=Sphingomonas immobilis TaxID=3063997 RepID=UPI00272CF038|nr:hypothetical protein [Sphingomonas sp. CA1-15]